MCCMRARENVRETPIKKIKRSLHDQKQVTNQKSKSSKFF